MKILYVCPEFMPTIGGLVTHVYNLAYRIKHTYEADVTIYTLDKKLLDPKLIEIDGLKVKRFSSVAPNRLYYFCPEMLLSLTKELKAEHYDLVHVHSYTNFCPLAYYVAETLSSSNTKSFFTPHFHPISASPTRQRFRQIYDSVLEKNIFNAFDKVIALTVMEKSRLSRYYPDEKISIIPNGIDLAEFRDHSEDSFRCQYMLANTPYILYAGNLLKYKGVDVFLNAADKLIKKGLNFKVVVIGDGDYRLYLENLAKKLGISDKVIFTGYLDRNLLVSAMKGCSVFVMPSSYEAFSIATVEAMACKKPVIVTNRGGLRSLSISSEFMVEYGDTQVLSEKIMLLLEKPSVALLVGEENYQAAIDYSWDAVTKATYELYTSC